MLETVDLTQRVPKAEYKARLRPLQRALAQAQQELYTSGRRAVVVLEGWAGVGVGDVMRRLVARMDPRGFTVQAINPPTADERRFPFLRRFWLRLPPRGHVGIFCRSWYRDVLVRRVETGAGDPGVHAAYEDITAFEEMLVDDGYVVLKYWLHIDRELQEKRLRRIAAHPEKHWAGDAADGPQHLHYDAYAEAVEEMLARTETAWTPWSLVSASDEPHMVLSVLESVNATLELAARADPPPVPPPAVVTAASQRILEEFDLSPTISRQKYDAELGKLQSELRQLQFAGHRASLPVVVVFQGWDAAGKGGCIRRLTAKLDPRGYVVRPVQAPAGEEAEHHYLWRFWRGLPKSGHWTIFDRSWYGRVLVERVEDFAPEAAWRRAYHEINAFERGLRNAGVVLVKFWLHISRDEQLRRFEAREQSPHKAHKLTDQDWRNREKWDEYLAAASEMLHRTSTADAPWTIVAAESKQFARIAVLRAVRAAVKAALDPRK